MAIRNIIKEGDSVLHKKCRPVERFDEKLAILLDDMIATLKKANGVGLAAPQVGILRRLFIIDVDDEIIEAVNPEIIKTSGKQREVEGCLSVPNKWGYVTRPRSVTLCAYDRHGVRFERRLTDLAARCACHEYDHLDGRLFTSLVEQYVEPEQ